MYKWIFLILIPILLSAQNWGSLDKIRWDQLDGEVADTIRTIAGGAGVDSVDVDAIYANMPDTLYGKVTHWSAFYPDINPFDTYTDQVGLENAIDSMLIVGGFVWPTIFMGPSGRVYIDSMYYCRKPGDTLATGVYFADQYRLADSSGSSSVGGMSVVGGYPYMAHISNGTACQNMVYTFGQSGRVFDRISVLGDYKFYVGQDNPGTLLATDLAEDLDDSETVVTIDAAIVGINDYIKIDDECMRVTDTSGVDLTVVRGVGGSSAAVHSNGTDVYEAWSGQAPHPDVGSKRILMLHFFATHSVVRDVFVSYSPDIGVECYNWNDAKIEHLRTQRAVGNQLKIVSSSATVIDHVTMSGSQRDTSGVTDTTKATLHAISSVSNHYDYIEIEATYRDTLIIFDGSSLATIDNLYVGSIPNVPDGIIALEYPHNLTINRFRMPSANYAYPIIIFKTNTGGGRQVGANSKVGEHLTYNAQGNIFPAYQPTSSENMHYVNNGNATIAYGDTDSTNIGLPLIYIEYATVAKTGNTWGGLITPDGIVKKNLWACDWTNATHYIDAADTAGLTTQEMVDLLITRYNALTTELSGGVWDVDF